MILHVFNSERGRVIFRTITENDLKRAKDYAEYINSIIDEDDYILMNKKATAKEEREWVKKNIKAYGRGEFTIVAECGGKIISVAEFRKHPWRMNHVASMGIAIKKGYRSIGVGSEMMKLLIEKARLMKCKMLRLTVLSTNKRAIGLYKKFGLKEVARIPKQIQRRGKLIPEVLMLKEL
jgi:putative acetyltransferase